MFFYTAFKDLRTNLQRLRCLSSCKQVTFLPKFKSSYDLKHKILGFNDRTLDPDLMSQFEDVS